MAKKDSKWQVLAVPSDEEWVIDGESELGQYLLEPFKDENGEIRMELFEEVDGKFYQKKNVNNEKMV